MAYITIDDVVGYQLIQSLPTPGDITLLNRFAAAAQQQIERKCMRRFEDTGIDETKYFDADSLRDYNRDSRRSSLFSWDSSLMFGFTQQALWLGDDLLSVTTLTNGDGTAILPASFRLYPRNNPPYQYIRLLSNTAWILGIDQEITVTGRWGFSATPPADIVTATLMLTQYYWQGRQSQVFDVVVLPDGQIQIPKGFPANVMKILTEGNYIRHIYVV